MAFKNPALNNNGTENITLEEKNELFDRLKKVEDEIGKLNELINKENTTVLSKQSADIVNETSKLETKEDNKEYNVLDINISKAILNGKPRKLDIKDILKKENVSVESNISEIKVENETSKNDNLDETLIMPSLDVNNAQVNNALDTNDFEQVNNVNQPSKELSEIEKSIIEENNKITAAMNEQVSNNNLQVNTNNQTLDNTQNLQTTNNNLNPTISNQNGEYTKLDINNYVNKTYMSDSSQRIGLLNEKQFLNIIEKNKSNNDEDQFISAESIMR